VHDPDEIEAVQGDFAVVALPDVVDHDPIAVAIRGGLRERAGAGDIAFAGIEPVAVDVPG
jgi:hypothetical protein